MIDSNARNSCSNAGKHFAKLNHTLEELASRRDSLQELVHSCHGDDRPDCPILKQLESGCSCA